MTSAHSAMRLEPFNYLLNDPSVQSNQQIRMNYTSGEVMRFESTPAQCSVDLVSQSCFVHDESAAS
jgi:primary-amine oxidase